MDLGPITDDADVDRHRAAFATVTDRPVRPSRVDIIADALPTLRAMWDAMRTARRSIVLEFYTLEDVSVDGMTLVDILLERRGDGVEIAIIYDAIGSNRTPGNVWTRLRAAGCTVMAFRGLDPLGRTFSLRINDRDHRKILVVDDRVAFLGGVNIDAQYLNPPSAGVPPDRDTGKAYWQDAAARFEGAVAADCLALFLHTWTRHRGEPLPIEAPASADARSGTDAGPDGEALVCVEGSAPREGRPLHLRALAAALGAARRRVWLASGYFVPVPSEIRALADTARRGVDVRLVLPGVSDVPGVVNAARASYGKLLDAGVRIHEMRGAVLHAKVSTIDGVWTSIGSSNLDRRSAVLNNEVDAVVFGAAPAAAVEGAMRAWFAAGVEIRLNDWRRRSARERAAEFGTLLWKRLM